MKRIGILFLSLAILLTLVLCSAPTVRADEGECPHQWVLTKTVPATCTESGFDLYVCALCGAQRQEPIPALGHVWSYCTLIKKATCTEEGLTRCYCARDESHYEDKTEPALGHAWGDWHVTKQATLNEWGSLERRCDRCGEIEQQWKPPLAYRGPYRLALILSPLPAEVQTDETSALSLIQEVALVNTGENDLTVGEYSIREGMRKELPEPLQLRSGEAVTFPLSCVLAPEELSLVTSAGSGGADLSMTLSFYGSSDTNTVCTSNPVPWTVTLADSSEASDAQAHPVKITQSTLSSCADPDGYQLSETLRGMICVTNTTDELLPEIRLQAAFETDPLSVSSLAPGETRYVPWAHAVTTEEVIAGYTAAAWQASWSAEGDGASRHEASNVIVVPTVSKLNLLLEIWPENAPANGAYYEAREEICFRLRLRNNGKYNLLDVTLFDPLYGTDPDHAAAHLDGIRSGEEQSVESRYIVTTQDSQAGSILFTAAAQGYDMWKNMYSASGQVILPTAAEGPAPE